MKSLSPHDPFDDLIAAALHGELSPEERTQFDARLQNDPAAQAAYQKAQAMHDLLEKTHQSAQPDSAFEQRMVSGVRRKIQHDDHRETAWESLLVLWREVKKRFTTKRPLWEYIVAPGVTLLFVGVLFFTLSQGVLMKASRRNTDESFATKLPQAALPNREELAEFKPAEIQVHMMPPPPADLTATTQAPPRPADIALTAGETKLIADVRGKDAGSPVTTPTFSAPVAATSPPPPSMVVTMPPAAPLAKRAEEATKDYAVQAMAHAKSKIGDEQRAESADLSNLPTVTTSSGLQKVQEKVRVFPNPATNSTTDLATVPDTRKLIRNAQLDLEVKSFQNAIDQIAALTKAAGGYVDTSTSQKGGNGKLQGTVVVKVLPQNLDAFLLKLRELGQVANQSVSTDDVTKDYYDTRARLENSRRMETQLQELLKHENSKVADLLEVERELGRVRGEIEQMQGQLKLYDFQVQYATVTMQLREKDLNQAAAYLLREQDAFALFSTDVEGTFQKARQTADDFKAQTLVANLNHNSGSDVSAELQVMVAPDQIEPFLGQVRGLGRVANFTRQTQRVAKDGGDSDQPADQTRTEKDKVQVNLTIRSDDETRKQVALTVVAKVVDDALDQAKTAALSHAGVEILSSSLNKTPEGQSTAQLSVRVPGKDYAPLIDLLRKLGRTASFSIQRNDNSGPGANGDDAPVIISLALTDDDTPLQQTQMTVLTGDVDQQSQQIKKDAAAAGVEVKASSFERQPDGMEYAQLTLRLPMAKYPAFLESVKKSGKVESLTVRRSDRPDQTITDDAAPAEISLQLHNQREIVTENNGLWATLRETFGEGFAALFGSIRVIGVLIAFTVPWLFTLVLLAWVGRRIYIWRRK